MRTAPSGATLAFANLEELLAYPRFAVYLMKEDDANEINEIKATLKAVLEGENPLPPSRLKRDLQTLPEERLKRPLPVVAGAGWEALRVTAYRRRAVEGEKIVAHFVNYKCQVPLNAKEQWNLAPQPARDIRVRLPLSHVTGARLMDPDGAPPQPLLHTQKGGAVEFTLPEVRIYQHVEISGGPASGQ